MRPDTVTPASRADFLAAAEAIARRLDELAIRGVDDATWMTIVATSGTQSTVAPMAPDLYGGLAGTAFFLGYLGHIDGDPAHTALARQALTAMLRQLDHASSPPEIGAFAGLGGIVYTLAHLGFLWDDATLLDRANQLAGDIDDLIATDNSYDFLAGAAGAIRSLLVLDAISTAPGATATAIRCGDHLLRRATKVGDGIGWLSESARSTQPLSGLAHGTPGIAWPLFELASHTGQQRFVEAAAAAITYERSLFSRQVRYWRDVRILDRHRRFARQIGDHRYMFYWCHGSMGIGLARIHTLRHWNDGKVEEEIRDALTATSARGFGLNHSLCHGDLGNLELSLSAPTVLVEPEPEPFQLASRILAGAHAHGWVTGHPLGLESPDLMTGITGIGFMMLRLAEPQIVPSILTLDPPTGL